MAAKPGADTPTTTGVDQPTTIDKSAGVDQPSTGTVGGTKTSMSYTSLTAAQRAAMRKYDDLAKKTGTDFDRAYLSEVIDGHKKNIKVFEKESKRGEDAELKSWATNTLPTLRHHLEMAQTLEKDIKGRSTSSM